LCRLTARLSDLYLESYSCGMCVVAMRQRATEG
jgi:hypothetical protein